MKRFKDVGVVLVVAALTAVSAGLVLKPSTAGAEDPITVKNVISGAEISVAFDKSTYEPGEKPVLTVTAKNPGEEAITCESKVRLTTSPVFELSRAPSWPREVWNRDLCLTLKPGESKTVVLKPDTAFAEGDRFGALVMAKDAPVAGFIAMKVEAPVTPPPDQKPAAGSEIKAVIGE